MQLDEFFDYKNQLMADLTSSMEIVRLLNDEFRVCKNPESLIYSQIFPYEYIPNAVTHGQTFICCDVDIQRSVNKTYWSPILYLWVFTHKSKLRLPEGGVRTDKLCSEISKKINGSRSYGLGELELYSVKRFAPITDYQGKVMLFQANDFNRPHPSHHPIPSNRKTG